MVMSMLMVISLHTEVVLEDLESDNILHRVVFRSITSLRNEAHALHAIIARAHTRIELVVNI
jgi:hypothetical protein